MEIRRISPTQPSAVQGIKSSLRAAHSRKVEPQRELDRVEISAQARSTSEAQLVRRGDPLGDTLPESNSTTEAEPVNLVRNGEVLADSVEISEDARSRFNSEFN